MVDLPLINDEILSCLFQPCYIEFDQCVRLELVSKAFLRKAHQFCQRLVDLNFKDHSAKEGQVKWASKISKRCLNVQKILNLAVSKKNFESDVLNFQFISKMPNVTTVSVNFQHFSVVILMILADMGNLSRLEVSTAAVKSSRNFRDAIEIKEINVASLKCDTLLFINFCNPDHLSVLNLDCMNTTADEYVSKLKRLRNLRELSLELYQSETVECVLKVINFVAQVPQIQVFSLGLVFYHCREEQNLLNLLSHRMIRECLHRLQMCNFHRGQADAFESCLGKLTGLRLLTLQYVSFEPGNFLPMLSNLTCFKTMSRVRLLRGRNYYCDVGISYERWVGLVKLFFCS